MLSHGRRQAERMQIHAGLPLLFPTLSALPSTPSAPPFVAIFPLDDSIATQAAAIAALAKADTLLASHRLGSCSCQLPPTAPLATLASISLAQFSTGFSFTALSYAIFTKCLPRRRCVSCCAFFQSLSTTPRDICSTLNGHLSVAPRPAPPSHISHTFPLQHPPPTTCHSAYTPCKTA